jgi:hypothetical protein
MSDSKQKRTYANAKKNVMKKLDDILREPTVNPNRQRRKYFALVAKLKSDELQQKYEDKWDAWKKTMTGKKRKAEDKKEPEKKKVKDELGDKIEKMRKAGEEGDMETFESLRDDILADPGMRKRKDAAKVRKEIVDIEEKMSQPAAEAGKRKREEQGAGDEKRQKMAAPAELGKRKKEDDEKDDKKKQKVKDERDVEEKVPEYEGEEKKKDDETKEPETPKRKPKKTVAQPLRKKYNREVSDRLQKSREKREAQKLIKSGVDVNRIKAVLDGDAETRAPNEQEAAKELTKEVGEDLHTDEINEAPLEEPMQVEPAAPQVEPVAAPVAAPPAAAPPAAAPPAAAPAQPPAVAQPMPTTGEFVEEKVAYPGAMGIQPAAAAPMGFDARSMAEDEQRQRMKKTIKQLKVEITCFRELYKSKIEKIKQLSRVSMENKTIDEIRALHKQHSDVIRDYYTANRGLRVGVIVDPSVLGINMQGLQNMIAPRVPIVQPPVIQARDMIRPKDQKQQAALNVSEVHYQLGGLRAVGLGGGYDRDIAMMNKGQDRQQDVKLHNRQTTRFNTGQAPVFKNYGYQNNKTFIASGIKLKGSKKY